MFQDYLSSEWQLVVYVFGCSGASRGILGPAFGIDISENSCNLVILAGKLIAHDNCGLSIDVEVRPFSRSKFKSPASGLVEDVEMCSCHYIVSSGILSVIRHTTWHLKPSPSLNCKQLSAWDSTSAIPVTLST